MKAVDRHVLGFRQAMEGKGRYIHVVIIIGVI